ncbi:MAG TPA: ABC transporter ATP-binding protein [Nitrososphaerales archaeon]|nr:ABC transporter ATP-binding protein [Nitrososphaerales archaeon]
MPTSILQVKEITKTFEKKGARREENQTIDVLEQVSFDLKEGSLTSIIGPSGCGKTTLLRIIDGLVEPSSGEVIFGGKPVRSPPTKMGFVFQQFGLLPWRSVQKNVELGLELHGVEAQRRKEIAEKYLKIVGLQGFENNYIHEISGGMQQRAGLARALAIDPEVLLMDEPFASIDEQTREILQRQLLQIVKGAIPKTTLLVTHNVDEAIYLSDEIVLLSTRPGRVNGIIPVNLPPERWTYDLRSKPGYTSLRNRIWKFLENEIVGKGVLEAYGLRAAA